jgi:hypothetical protein
VNLCTLGISNASGNNYHTILFITLMKRGIPKTLLILLINWSSLQSSHGKVRWLYTYSHSYFLTLGVRQSGVLPPLMFDVCYLCERFIIKFTFVRSRLFYQWIVSQLFYEGR